MEFLCCDNCDVPGMFDDIGGGGLCGCISQQPTYIAHRNKNSSKINYSTLSDLGLEEQPRILEDPDHQY